MSEDTRWDLWLDKHPRVDHTIRLVKDLKWKYVDEPINSHRDRRDFPPGGFYLDHGTTPCVVIEVRDGAVEGVSLVDGRIISGCDIYHCGPMIVTREEAMKIAEELRAQ